MQSAHSEANLFTPRQPIVVSIAGSDPSAGAGIQADLKTFAALNVYGMNIISMLTAQNYRQVSAVEAVSTTMFDAQFRSIFDVYAVSAVKIGMIGDPRIIERLASLLHEYRPKHIVFDPVMRSSSGGDLSDIDIPPRTLFTPLFPLIELLTPNIPEASALLGRTDPADSEERGDGNLLTALDDLGVNAVLLKGGHGSNANYCIDRLRSAGINRTFQHERIHTSNLHGTGCTLSSAIAGFLALDFSLEQAVENAIAFTHQAIRNAHLLAVSPFNGPLHHFYQH